MDTVLRDIAIYAILLAATRLSDWHVMAQTTPFDVVLLPIVAEASQQALLGDDSSLTNAVILTVTLFAFDMALSYAKRSSSRIALWLDASPTVLMSLAQIYFHGLRRAPVSVSNTPEVAHIRHGIRTLGAIGTAVPKIGGTISITPQERRDG